MAKGKGGRQFPKAATTAPGKARRTGGVKAGLNKLDVVSKKQYSKAAAEKRKKEVVKVNNKKISGARVKGYGQSFAVFFLTNLSIFERLL